VPQEAASDGESGIALWLFNSLNSQVLYSRSLRFVCKNDTMVWHGTVILGEAEDLEKGVPTGSSLTAFVRMTVMGVVRKDDGMGTFVILGGTVSSSLSMSTVQVLLLALVLPALLWT
jgi:hypothetical protein